DAVHSDDRRALAHAARTRADRARGRVADRRREGPPLVRHLRRHGAVARQVHPHVVPAAGRARGPLRPVHGAAVSRYRRRRRLAAAVRSRQRADPRVRTLVCVKRVPITGGKMVLTADGHALETKHLGFTISPHEECAVEEAVRIGGEVVVLTLGPAEAEEQLRDCMAIGADRGILLKTDEEWDAQSTAAAIVDAIRAEEPFDLILFGNESAD